jgi:hypothetical protein
MDLIGIAPGTFKGHRALKVLLATKVKKVTRETRAKKEPRVTKVRRAKKER